LCCCVVVVVCSDSLEGGDVQAATHWLDTLAWHAGPQELAVCLSRTTRAGAHHMATRLGYMLRSVTLEAWTVSEFAFVCLCVRDLC
jgi:hypothetical protein